MITFYFVRHCEASGNKERRFQGHIDSNISENGENQLKYLKKRFKNVHIDEIFTSPLLRAKKTAEAVKGERNIKITEMPLLIEIDGGDIENMLFTEIYEKYPEVETSWFDAPEKYYSPGGESMEDIYSRAVTAITELCKTNDGKVIAVTSHGVFFRALMCYIYWNDLNKLNSTPWFDNTGITKCIYENGKFTVKYYNSVSHLPKNLLPEFSKIVAERSPE